VSRGRTLEWSERERERFDIDANIELLETRLAQSFLDEQRRASVVDLLVGYRARLTAAELAANEL
jgi:hypothetical protein